MKKLFVILAACGLTLSAHAGCYTVYNRAGQLIHQSSEAPVDTRYEYHRTVPQRFGAGATLVYISDDQRCQDLAAQAGMSGVRTAPGQGRPGRADRG